MDKTVIQFVLIHIGLVVLICMNFVTSQNNEPPIRYDDKAFPPNLKIYQRNITCLENFQHGKYPSHTYTCKDMRVDGLRMAYGYHPSINKNDKCNETKGFDEIAEICRSVMRAIASPKKLWSAAVTNATCDFIDEKRVLLNMTQTGGYRWDEMKPGHGWVDTLQCMALKDVQLGTV